MNENSLIKDIGRSYIVSSFLPAALFVSLGVLIFRGFVPNIIANRVLQQDEFYGTQWFLFVVFTVWVAFSLYSISDWTIRLYEGYFFPSELSQWLINQFFIKDHERKSKTITVAIDLKQEITMRKMSGVSPSDPDLMKKTIEFNRAFRQAKQDFANLEKNTPLNRKDLLPTRLGNILRSSEIYPNDKYNIYSIVLWPRLAHVLPKPFMDQLEEKNNQMVFLLNSSLLSYIIGVIAFLVAGVRLFFDYLNLLTPPTIFIFPPDLFQNGFQIISKYEFLLVGFLGIFSGYLIYRLAIPAAENFSNLIKSAFDLYRFDLLRQMNHPLPKTIEDEKNYWSLLSEHLIAGDRLALIPPKFDYSPRRDLVDYLLLEKELKEEKKVVSKVAME